jgi:hypothetical protein
MRAELGFEVLVRDVDAEPALEERYGELVPVLEHEGVELARYRLDEPGLRRWFETRRTPL